MPEAQESEDKGGKNAGGERTYEHWLGPQPEFVPVMAH